MIVSVILLNCLFSQILTLKEEKFSRHKFRSYRETKLTAKIWFIWKFLYMWCVYAIYKNYFKEYFSSIKFVEVLLPSYISLAETTALECLHRLHWECITHTKVNCGKKVFKGTVSKYMVWVYLIYNIFKYLQLIRYCLGILTPKCYCVSTTNICEASYISNQEMRGIKWWGRKTDSLFLYIMNIYQEALIIKETLYIYNFFQHWEA